MIIYSEVNCYEYLQTKASIFTIICCLNNNDNKALIFYYLITFNSVVFTTSFGCQTVHCGKKQKAKKKMNISPTFHPVASYKVPQVLTLVSCAVQVCCAPEERVLQTRSKKQWCCCADVSPQWRPSPLTPHTQTMFRGPFVHTSQPPTTSTSLHVSLANPTSSAENKQSPPLLHPPPPASSGRT